MIELRQTTDEITRRVREREIRRQLLANRLGKAVVSRVPPLLAEFLKMTGASLIGYWLIAELVSLAGVKTVYTLTAFALVYSAQATYYKVRLAADPEFRIPSCNCAGAARDDTETVLRSRYSAVLGVPNSVLALVVYSAVGTAIALEHGTVARVLAATLVLASVYLGYAMVAKVASLCTMCVNLAALNVLILVELVR